ncbi:MAG: LacI family DNA-binding transcriptional regulator [Kineosporiaceae bacterium]
METRRRQPTLDEVAERAGVSRTAASRVINNAPHVSSAKREAVERAIRDLGYVPHRAARALSTQRSGAVALAISLADPAVLADPFFAKIIVGVSAGLEDTDLHLVLALSASPRGEARLKTLLGTQGVDGILPMSVGGDDALAKAIEAAGVPAVYGGRPSGRRPRWYVDVDNYGGARQATEHLLRQGRTRIATITGPPDTHVAQARLRGYQEALALAGLKPHGIRHADFTEEGGATAMERLFDWTPDLDALVVQSDNMALGAMRVLRESGRRIPEDVAVVGFDDLRITDPPLTTVRQPIDAMGREMVRMLLEAMAGGDPHPVVLPTTLVVKGSG